MVSRNREQPANDASLLFTTMCIIGLPVDVQVKDGSLYSGIFHTACLDKGYGIVLKMARMTRKGNNDANLAKGALIDTLVILSSDLVQVVAKGVLFPADGLMGNVAGKNAETVIRSVEAQSCIDLERELKLWEPEQVPERITMEDSLEICENGGLDQNEENKTASGLGKMNNVVEDGTLPTVEKGYEWWKVAEEPLESVPGARNDKVEDTSVIPTTTINEGQVREERCQGKEDSNNQNCEMSVSPESEHSDILTSNVSTSSTSLLDINSNLAISSTGFYPSKSPSCNKNSKEFKLNPCAKTFLPSGSAPISSVDCIPNSSSVLPVVGSQLGTEINPFMARASLPVKFVQSNNPLAGYGCSGSQYSQPVVGHLGGRQQPVRYAAQHLPVQAGPTYVHPNSQTVMVGRLGPLLYVQPFSHDPMQGASTLPGSARPLFVPHQTPLPKHQGSTAHPLQLCMAPSFIAGAAQQPFSMPNISISPPFPTIRPLSVPSVNGVLCSKFPL